MKFSIVALVAALMVSSTAAFDDKSSDRDSALHNHRELSQGMKNGQMEDAGMMYTNDHDMAMMEGDMMEEDSMEDMDGMHGAEMGKKMMGKKMMGKKKKKMMDEKAGMMDRPMMSDKDKALCMELNGSFREEDMMSKMERKEMMMERMEKRKSMTREERKEMRMMYQEAKMATMAERNAERAMIPGCAERAEHSMHMRKKSMMKARKAVRNNSMTDFKKALGRYNKNASDEKMAMMMENMRMRMGMDNEKRYTKKMKVSMGYKRPMLGKKDSMKDGMDGMKPMHKMGTMKTGMGSKKQMMTKKKGNMTSSMGDMGY